MTRPSESITAIVGSVIGALLIIFGAFGLEVEAAVAAAIVTLVSWIAVLVTWWVGRKQRAGDLGSAPDGTVTANP